MNLKDLKNELLRDPEFRKEYYKNNLKLDTALMIEKARVIAGLTQKELAKKMKTKQAAISRAESGNYLPSLSFLERMAKALGTELIAPKFAFLEESLDKEQNIPIDRVAQISDTVSVAAKLLYANSKSSAYTSFAEIKLTK